MIKMTGVCIFEILGVAVCSANLVLCVVTGVHELIVWVKKKRHERAEEQEMIMMLKDKNHRFSDEICALRAKVTELEAKAIPKKVENHAIDWHGYMIYDCECQSCKTEHKEMYPFAYCPHCGQALDWGNYETPDPDDYCSYGELKDGDTE